MTCIAIAAVGSRGDVAPIVGLGRALHEAKHRVVIAAYAPFEELITGNGLEFRALPGDPADGGDVNPVKAIGAFLAPSGIEAMGRAVLDALQDVPADVYLLSPFSEFAGHPLAEAKGAPSIGIRLQPLSATHHYPPAILGGWSVGARGNRLAANAGGWILDRLYGGVVARFRTQLGLAPSSARTCRRLRTRAEWPVLRGYSPSVVPRPADWRPGLDVVGYWWPPRTSDWSPPSVLADFLASGPPPVFVGFGSTMNSVEQAQRISDIVTLAFRRAGVRGIVQSGWAGLEVAGEDVLTVGEVPHDWLFPRMAAVAHHCGAGTAAAGLRAGVPTIAIPGLGDQPFWARRLRDLGVSAATISQRNLTAARLGDAIQMAVCDSRIRDSSQSIAARINTEDGEGRAVAAVEKALVSS